jgi:phosphatidate cytidylyltransferase
MKPELKKRVMTGVAGGAVLLGVTLGLGEWGTAVFAVALSLLMAHEYLEMVLKLEDRPDKRNVVMGAIFLVSFFGTVVPGEGLSVPLLGILGLLFYFLFTAHAHAASADRLEAHLREGAYVVLGVIYLGVLPVFLTRIRQEHSGAYWFLLFLLMNWVGDSAAYFVGLKKGKQKLYPEISPKKTWEGAWGGLAGAYVVTVLFKLVALKSMSWLFVCVGPAVVGAAAQVGDLCESFIKRAFDKKDSGSLLPGHGGFMDRFDGVVVSAPFMYYCVRLFG